MLEEKANRQFDNKQPQHCRKATQSAAKRDGLKLAISRVLRETLKIGIGNGRRLRESRKEKLRFVVGNDHFG